MVIFMGALLMKSLCAATSFGNDTGLKKSDCGAKQGDLALQMGTRQTSGIEDYSLILQPEINSGDDVEVIAECHCTVQMMRKNLYQILNGKLVNLKK